MSDGSSQQDIQAAREELDAIIADIRKIPGYEDFSSVPTFDDVADVAADCPLVYIAAADPGGLALLVRGADITYLPLDGLTSRTLRDRVTAHLGLYERYRVSREENYAMWNRSLEEVTAWLWDEVMGPIINYVNQSTNLVVIAGGLLGVLPLHAAWMPDAKQLSGRRYALDCVPVSYVPNARALRVARRLAATVPSTRLLSIADPQPVSAPPLPMAKYEVMAAEAAFPASHKTLNGSEATFLSFEWEAAKANVLHMACHGYALLENPLKNSLVLAGGNVTLERLMELHLRVRLAVLSACETALPGTDLPDEVIALPTGLLQAGVAGIVASQWSVPDRATAMMMTEFYRQWIWERETPSASLRAAQRWLRDTTSLEKRAHFVTAINDCADWLPTGVANAFLDWLDLEPDGRNHADIHYWGAFAHVGA